MLKATIPVRRRIFSGARTRKDPAKPPLVWLKDKAPVDCLITQPFAGHCRSVENELENTGNFFKECRKYSPKARLWIYQQWSGPDSQRWLGARRTGVEQGGRALEIVATPGRRDDRPRPLARHHAAPRAGQDLRPGRGQSPPVL